MSYQKDRDEFIGVIVAECNAQRHPQEQGTVTTYADAVAVARLILRNAKTHQRLATQACNNGGLSEHEERHLALVRHCIKDACQPWGIKPMFSSDPRGATVKLRLPSGRNNSWCGPEPGFCVPVR